MAGSFVVNEIVEKTVMPPNWTTKHTFFKTVSIWGRSIKGAKCTSDFWQHRGKNVLHVAPGIKFAFCNLDFLNVMALGAATFSRLVPDILTATNQNENGFVLILVEGKMTQTRIKRPIWPFDPILRFCNFAELHGPILHYRHIFSVRVDLNV